MTTNTGLDLESAVGATAIPLFVVFADDTAIGDDVSIASIFQRRAVHQRFWHLLQSSLDESARIGAAPDTAFRNLELMLDADADPEVKNTAMYAEMRRRISTAALTPPGQSPSAILQELMAETEARRSDIDSHAKRRLER